MTYTKTQHTILTSPFHMFGVLKVVLLVTTISVVSKVVGQFGD